MPVELKDLPAATCGPLETYEVQLDTPKGRMAAELKSTLGAGAAVRRAHWSLVHAGYGDLDDIKIIGWEKLA